MTNELYLVQDSQLWIGHQHIRLPYPVKHVLRHGDNLVISIESAPGVIFNRNVFAVSMHGEVLWQIEESPHGTQADQPYMDVYCDQNGELIAGNWNGISYSVNLTNGTVCAVAFEKSPPSADPTGDTI